MAAAAGRPSAAERFGHEILPILEANRLDCHDRGKTKGGLDLATLTGVPKGGSEGPALVAGRSAASLLHGQIAEGELPPDGKNPVTPGNLKRIADWIDRSALPNPAQVAALATAEVYARAKSPWSFLPVRRPDLPSVGNAAAVRTPVDHYIVAKLES